MILALDTCEATCSAALLQPGGECLAQFSDTIGRGHAEYCLPRVQELLAEASVRFEAVTRLAVTTGPGNFTGVRVGLSVMRGLGVALDCPVLGISALEVLAHQAPSRKETVTIHSVIAGRGGQAFHQAYGVRDQRVDGAISEARRLDLDEIQREVQRCPGPLVGSGAALIDKGAISQPISAETLAALALERDPADCPAVPLYLKPADAAVARPVFPTAPQPRP